MNSPSDFSKWFYSFLLKLCSRAGKLSCVTRRKKIYTSFLSFVCNLSMSTKWLYDDSTLWIGYQVWRNSFSTTLDNKITTKLLSFLTLLPTGGGGGGGGFLSHTTIVLAATVKPLKLWLPNFVTSCFYLFATIWENFSKIDRPGGCYSHFQTRAHEKLETWKFFFLLKMGEICREYNFRSGKSLLIRKKWFWHH